MVCGDSAPQLSTYITNVTRLGTETFVHLGPIDVERVRDGRAVIRSLDVDEPFEIYVDALQVNTRGEAVAPISHARTKPLANRTKPRMSMNATRPLAMMVHGEIDGTDANIFPVTDISDDSCAIETTFAMSPGLTFPRVELVGERRTLRRASATVLGFTPRRLPSGSLRFRVRLQLTKSEDKAPRDYSLIDSRERLDKLFDVVSALQLPISLSVIDSRESEGHNKLSGRMSGQTRDTFQLTLERELVGNLRGRVRVSCEVFAVSYEFDVRVVDHHRRSITLALPLLVRQRRRRQQRRFSAPEGLAVSFTHPATGERTTRDVLDVSYTGLSFLADESRDVVWDDLPLSSGTLTFQGRDIEIGDLEVRSVREVRGIRTCYVERKGSGSDDTAIVDLLTTIAHPTLTTLRDARFEDLESTFEACGLMHGFMKQNVIAARSEVSEGFHAATRDAASNIIRTTVHREASGEIDGTITVLRAWENNWLTQHFGVTGREGFRHVGDLQMSALDFMLPHPTTRFVSFFVHEKNKRMNSFYNRFFSLSGTEEAMERSGVRLFRLPREAAAKLANVDLQRETRTSAAQRTVIERGAEIAYGPSMAASVSLSAEHLKMRSLSKEYRRAGLERSRHVRVVNRRGRAAYSVVTEHATPGLNLTWMLNGSWLVPIHGRPEDDSLVEAASIVASRKSPTSTGDRFLMTPPDFPTEPLTALGFEHVLNANYYVMNRVGLHRYYHYIVDRYGLRAVEEMRPAMVRSA